MKMRVLSAKGKLEKCSANEEHLKRRKSVKLGKALYPFSNWKNEIHAYQSDCLKRL
jgi:hypothetical protein